MATLKRPQECVNAGCIACCGIADYEFYKGIFKDNAQKCPNYKRGMIPMSAIDDIKAEVEGLMSHDDYMVDGFNVLDIINKHTETKAK